MEADEQKTIESVTRENEILRSQISELQVLQNEIKQIRKISAESDERFNAVFEYAPDAYYISDLKGTFINGNRAAEAVVGYNKEDLIGKSFLKLDLLPVNYISKAAQLLAKNALGWPTGPDEFVLKRSDGSRITVEISTHPIKLEDKTVVLGVIYDINNRKRQEQDLQERDELLRIVMNHIDYAVLRLKEDGTIIDANNNLENVFGYRHSDIRRQNIFRMGLVSPADAMKVAGYLSEVVSGGDLSAAEFDIKHKDGNILPVTAGVKAIRDDAVVKEIVILARPVS